MSRTSLSALVLLLLFVNLPQSVAELPAVSRSEVRRATSQEISEPPIFPIIHQPYFRGERELFGYRPAFMPNMISFDPENSPYIRDQFRIQKLDRRTRIWRSIDLMPVIRSRYPAWNGDTQYRYDDGSRPRDIMSVGSDQRVVFDDRGDAYTIFPTNRWGGSVWEVLLLHWLHDQDRWEVHALPSDLSYALLEHYDAYNDKSRPPVILANSYYNDGDAIVGHELFLIVPTRNSDGTLTLPAPVLLTDDAIHTYPGNGGSNLVITRGRYSYIVWAASQAVMSSGKSRVNGTPTYIIRYDHETRGLSEPVFLGLGGTAIDDHNTPAITIDRDGYLHVILGAHHQSFLYTKSLRPHSIDRGGWSTPSRIGGTTPGPEDPECISDTCDGYTYVSLIADQQNNLHLAARWAGSIGPVYSDGSTSHYSAQLVYLRKKSGEDWERRRSLVIPHHPTYSHWYQRIDSDRTGRLFLYYSYYADRLYSEEVEAYQAKWPEEAPLRYHANQSSTSCAANSPCYTTGPTSMYTMPLSERCECSYYRSVKEHDPVLLISDDGGDSWRIAVTNDFLIPDPLPSVGGRTVIPAGSIQRASKVPKEPRLKNLPRSKRGQKSGGP